jgi:hypothetical protein
MVDMDDDSPGWEDVVGGGSGGIVLIYDDDFCKVDSVQL